MLTRGTNSSEEGCHRNYRGVLGGSRACGHGCCLRIRAWNAPKLCDSGNSTDPAASHVYLEQLETITSKQTADILRSISGHLARRRHFQKRDSTAQRPRDSTVVPAVLWNEAVLLPLCQLALIPSAASSICGDVALAMMMTYESTQHGRNAAET